MRITLFLLVCIVFLGCDEEGVVSPTLMLEPECSVETTAPAQSSILKIEGVDCYRRNDEGRFSAVIKNVVLPVSEGGVEKAYLNLWLWTKQATGNDAPEQFDIELPTRDAFYVGGHTYRKTISVEVGQWYRFAMTTIDEIRDDVPSPPPDSISVVFRVLPE